MSTKATPLALRLFLEGVEAPVISAQISMTPGQPASAAVQIIPTDAGLNFLPRTLVHLFVLENIVNPELADILKSEPVKSAQRDRVHFHDEAYILAYCGEVIGLSYSKSSLSRNLVLQCMDLSSYWDTCYQWFADYSVNGNALTDKIHTFVGSKKGLFDNIASGHKWVVAQLLNSKPRSAAYKNTEGLLGGIIHLLEAVGGVRPVKTGAAYSKGFKGVTDFFTIAEARYNIMGQIGAVEGDKTSARIYSGKAFIDWMRNGMGSMGSLLSFRDILRQVGQWIFHDVYPNPSPYFTDKGERSVTVSRSSWDDTAAGGSIIRQCQESLKSLEKMKTLLNTGTADSFQQAGTESVSVLKYVTQAASFSRSITADDVASLRSQLDVTKSSVEVLVRQITSVTPGQEAARISDLLNVVTSVEKTITDIVALTTRPRGTKVVGVTRSTHMYTQLILPETYFIVPPKCNVLFPDQVTSISYSRNFAREITRLSMSAGTYVAGQNVSLGLGGDLYYAPLIRDVRGNTLVATKSGVRVLLPHELHSGIVPKMSWATGGHKWGVKAAKARQELDNFHPKFGYLERLSHFQFYQERWMSRQLSVECVYNPYIVLGFPAILIDKPIYSEEDTKSIEASLGRTYRPTQFLGKVAAVTHAINQEGGRTLVSMTHARTHRGRDDEFLGALLREKIEPRSPKVMIPVEKIIRTPALGGKDQDEFIGVISQYLQKRLIPNKNYFKNDKILKIAASTKTFSLSKELAKSSGVGTEVIPEGADSVSVPVRITLTVQSFVRTGETTQMPIEDALMPGWYDQSWSKENISDAVYMPLLGVGSVYDTASVGDIDVPEEANPVVITDGGETDLTHELIYVTDEGVKVEKFFIQSPSLESVIDALATIYGMMKTRGLDVHQFIHDYTKRPIANMKQVLGTQNLEYGPNGEPLQEWDPETKTGMIEGFHSRAFGDYNAERQIDPDTGKIEAGTDAMVGLFKDVEYDHILKQGKRTPADKRVANYLDPRGQARLRVREYMRELTVSRGLRGL